MKKSLLSMAVVALAVSSVSAQDWTQPTAIENMVIVAMSPDGHWAVSNNIYGIFSIIDTTTGETWDYLSDDTYYYDQGSGNCVANDGTVLLTTLYEGDASYFRDGEIYPLNLGESLTGFANGITPDGSRICGTVGVGISLEDIIMQRPVIWERDIYGDYSECIILPHPTQDWTGRVPQYVQAIAISADGKTIAGQVHDYAGFMDQPIVWKENSEGEWTYEFVHPELINPNGIEFPPYPGEAPEEPNPMDYMTDENAFAYNEAMMDWDFISPQPDPADYMTADQLAEYNAAYAVWEQAFAEWEMNFYAFATAYEQASAESVYFDMNNVFLSPNGRYYATSHNYSDSFLGVVETWPYLFDLETGDYYVKKVEGETILCSYVNDNGTIMGGAEVAPGSFCRNGWIAVAPDADLIPLCDYVKSKDETLYSWMEENMVHNIEGIDDVWCTGTPIATPDLSILVSWISNIWDYQDPNYFYSYWIPSDALGGVEGVIFSGKMVKISVDRGGVINIHGDAADLNIYDLNGRVVFSTKHPAQSVATGLASGTYIVKVNGANGGTTIAKVII